ncbi:TetR/AcrR family transcriptional regulator [Nocardioides euryhalodurans]|uniref:TetR/AcrR family transcriptional regulator n=1 Tax=Nocardioides euryhalodurans TaxID=2518370 RepID=A0A4P7GL70_9ACTN|nr:TetR/AcrR family transcriptional regulator [Nocardioides euryhalodurans]QBR92554.1 TetR/AcrR family transcriptional regulator [Nocardioides euryhalodurans]
MPRDTTRRAELAEAATDHVLVHGLIGLSLRPLAEALGTSDRMLLYHFAGKDDLVATVLRTASDRSVAEVRALAPSPGVRRAVLDLWRAATAEQLGRCQRLYVEAAALGLLGREPYASVVAEANERWVRALADHLVASGARRREARRAVALVDATFMGLQLDLPLDPTSPAIRRVVRDVAAAAAVVAGQGSA